MDKVCSAHMIVTGLTKQVLQEGKVGFIAELAEIANQRCLELDRFGALDARGHQALEWPQTVTPRRRETSQGSETGTFWWMGPRQQQATERPPTATAVPPTDTPVPPTNTPVPPTDTPVPPTNTPVPPTDTPVPPTPTPLP